ncbi:MAG: aminotransferase class V-fold PLP-dependent enzyme [Steroidobacteraceae bacterium]
MVRTLVPQVAENGVYGERIAQICARYRISFERMTGDWMRALDLAAIARLVENAPHAGGAPFTHIAVVHHETTTGRLNDLRALGDLCRQHGTKLLVDAVSSFGTEPLDFCRSGESCRQVVSHLDHGRSVRGRHRQAVGMLRRAGEVKGGSAHFFFTASR